MGRKVGNSAVSRVVLTILSVLAVSCTESPNNLHPIVTQLEDAGAPEDIIEVAPVVDIELRSGHMTLSGHFIEKVAKVEVPLGGGWGYIQVAAKLDVPNEFDPNFLRVIFISDRIEWIASDALGNTYIFLNEEECLEAGLQCDDVIPGASESGYFKSGGPFDERLAVTNVHCSPTALPYELTVTAFVIDISYPSASIVSEESYLTIECIQKEQGEPENKDR